MEDVGFKNKENNKILKIKLNNNIGSLHKTILNNIKYVEDMYSKLLLVLFCCNNNSGKGTEAKVEVEIDCLISYISDKNNIDEKKIIKALDFWHRKKILEYVCLNNTSDISKDLFGEEINTGTIYHVPTSINGINEAQTVDENYKNKSMTQPIDKISETLETQCDFRRLIHDAQQKFKTIFNLSDLNVMFNLYETNKIDIDLLSRVMDICVLENKGNVKYLEKVALGLVSNGILTAEEYEHNYNETLKVKECEKRITKIFNLENRKFTSAERSYIKKWATEFDFSDEILRESYNICMEKLKELKFGYINGILSNWNAKRFTTLEDIRTEFKNNGVTSEADSRASSFNIEQFFEKAVKRAMASDD